MPRTLKVWGHGEVDSIGQRRYIVAAFTKKEAVELLKKRFHNLSRHYFDGWWSETGNSKELETATQPGVWVEVNQYSKDYERVI